MKPAVPHSALGTTFHAVTLLMPRCSESIAAGKQRFGRDRDGGYVLYTPWPGIPIFSYGVGDDWSFEQELAEKGHSVIMSDGSVDLSGKGMHEKIIFQQKYVGITNKSGHITVADDIEHHRPSSSSPVIIKMDIEGAEYSVIPTIPDLYMQRVNQFALEIHGLRQLNQHEFRAKFIIMMEHLLRHMSIIHVHANSYDGQTLSVVDGMIISDCVELTLVTDSKYHTVDTVCEVFPTDSDRPNVGEFDKPLWFYPFTYGLTGDDIVRYYRSWRNLTYQPNKPLSR